MKKKMVVILMNISVPPALKKYGEKFHIIYDQWNHSVRVKRSC